MPVFSVIVLARCAGFGASERIEAVHARKGGTNDGWRRFWLPFGTSLLAALVTLLGIHTIRRFTTWGNGTRPTSSALGGRVDCCVLPAHHPEIPLSMNAAAPTAVGGFPALHLFNRFVTAFVCERNPVRIMQSA